LDQIGALTLWQIEDVYAYWARCRPMHWLMAEYFGRRTGPRRKAVLLRGEAANEANRAGAEALMQFMDAAGPMLH
jgi:hypothetical protein